MGLCRESVDRRSRGSAAAASRRPALLCSSAAQWSCSSAPVLSLAWLTSLHLMVYSFHSGAGCCAMRIFSHSIYLPRTIFLPHGHLNWFALIWSLEQQPFSKLSENRKYSLVALHDDRCSVLLRCDRSQPAVSGLH